MLRVGMGGHRSLLMGMVWAWVQFKGKIWTLMPIEAHEVCGCCLVRFLCYPIFMDYIYVTKLVLY